MTFSKRLVMVLVGALSLIASPLFFPTQARSSPISPSVTSLPAASDVSRSNPEFSADRAYDHAKYLVQKVGPRPAGSKAELKAAQYISYVLNQSSWKVREQPFSKVVVREASILQKEQQVELINSQNIIAELPGSRPDTVVIGAHYDSANFNAPGAVDNASGVGVLLELARVLSTQPHDETYQFVFFGAEEYGLVGSQFYAAQSDLSAVRYMLNVDMVGTPLEIDVAGKTSAPPELIKQVTALAKERRIPFHLSRDSIIMTRESSQGGASDFSSFLDQRIPALGIGIAGRPAGFYHRPEDRMDHVSLNDLQKVGDYLYLLLNKVKMNQMGPRAWDELYLPFQVGNHVFILPSMGVRVFIFLTFLITGFLLLRFFRKKSESKLQWKNILLILGTTVLFSVVVMGVSGLGEFLWRWIKQVQTLWSAYPALFIGARVAIGFGVFLFLASWISKLPLARNPRPYWLLAVLILLLTSLLLTLVRIDIAFPFVFWLLCVDFQFIYPSLFLVLIGPYFIYRFHWELLNSQQWISFYDVLHSHFVLFLGIYSLLLLPLILAALHVTMSKARRWNVVLQRSRMFALAAVGLLILGLGLVPSYTRSNPQTVVVREEWTGSERVGKVHVFSNEQLPNKLIRDLNGQEGKSVFVATLNEKPPFEVETSVVERSQNEKRNLDVAFKLNYTNEPYIVRLTLQSSQPFKVQTDEFLPMSKLPKKLQLKGIQLSSEKYSLVLQRTPPQRNVVQLSIEAQGLVTCQVEAMFPDPSPRLQIQQAQLSIDYQIWFKEGFDF